MKKLISFTAIAALAAMVACGPSQADIDAKNKLVADSTEAARITDSTNMANVAAEATRVADSTAAATEAARVADSIATAATAKPKKGGK